MNRRQALAALCALALSACHAKPSFKSVDVTGAHFGRTFRLHDHTGRIVSLSDWRGKVVLVFFGYTQCPDICPTTLAQLAAVMKALGRDADRVQVAFITLDPERDTPEVLRHYVTAFDSRFAGLYGSAAEISAVAKEFNVSFQKVEGAQPGRYTLDHTTGIYLLDPQGRLRLFARPNAPASDLTHDIQQLLR